MDKHLKPVALYEAVLTLNSKDFEVLAGYINYLGEQVELSFYQYKDNPGLICVCEHEGIEVGKVQLVADREGNNMESQNKLNAVDPEKVLEVAEVLESALTTEPPYVFTINDEKGEYQQFVNREGFLEHYLNWAMETIYNLVDIEE